MSLVSATSQPANPPIDTAPSSTTSQGHGNLTSALNDLNLVGNIQRDSVVPAPFQVIGHTGTFDANGLTDLQILDSNGKPIQVPVQIVSTADNQCSIHFLSIAVDGEDKPILTVQEIDSTVPGEDLNIIQSIKLEEPCKTSTPAAHIKRLDETILAGNFDGRPPIHGPTPDTKPTPVTPPTPVET